MSCKGVCERYKYKRKFVNEKLTNRDDVGRCKGCSNIFIDVSELENKIRCPCCNQLLGRRSKSPQVLRVLANAHKRL